MRTAWGTDGTIETVFIELWHSLFVDHETLVLEIGRLAARQG
jgi:hypothetical protein